MPASDLATGRLKQVFASDFQSKFKAKIRDLELSGQILDQIMDSLILECHNEGM